MTEPARKLRVAHVATVDLSLRYLLLNQMLYLQREGYEVTGISAPGPDVPFIEGRGIPHIAVPMTRSMTPLADAKALADLVRIFRARRFDIVHTHTPKPGLIGQLAARIAGVPMIVNTIHGFYFHERMKPRSRAFFITMERIAALQSHAILSQSAEDVETAVRERICRREAIQLLGNGIDLARFNPAAKSEPERAAERERLGIPRGATVIGFVGRLVEEKGIPELFEAFRGVLRAHPEARLLVVGPTDESKADALRPERAAAYGIADACVFPGFRTDVEAMYAVMDVFVLPSHREGFPRAVMEASAMGKPVVATDIRGCREAVVHERSGLLVPVKDPTALGAALDRLLRDPELRARLGAGAVEVARERFDEQRVFRTVKETYERLARRRPLAEAGRRP